MSQISERCYHAGWLEGTEYLVPELCRQAIETGQTLRWGHGQVTPSEAEQLAVIADQLRCWADLDVAGIAYVEFKPFPLPEEYRERAKREILRI